MATMTSIQISTKSTQTSQQCLLSPIHQTSHQMDACHMWLPSKIYLAQSHQSRHPCRPANAKWTQCREVLLRDNWNSKRSLKSDKKKCALHQSQNSTFGNVWHLPTPRQESSRHLHHNIQGMQNHVLQSNRPIPYGLAKRQQVHHGYGGYWQQRHPCWAHEEPQGWGNDTGIQDTPAMTEVCRLYSQAHPQQQSFREHEESHPQHVQIWNRTSATWMSPTQCSQGGHLQLLSPLPQHPGCLSRRPNVTSYS